MNVYKFPVIIPTYSYIHIIDILTINLHEKKQLE